MASQEALANPTNHPEDMLLHELKTQRSLSMVHGISPQHDHALCCAVVHSYDRHQAERCNALGEDSTEHSITLYRCL